MLALESWQHLTKGIERGKKLYLDHDCGRGRTLLVSHDDKGYSAWCFRCSDGGHIHHAPPTLAELLAAQAAESAAIAQVVHTPDLPTPMVVDMGQWPAEAALWLLKAGIGAVERKKLRAYYCPPLNRVVLPVYEGDEVVYWQARSCDPKRKPKYINPLVDKRRVIPRFGSGPVVLTEDILSAFKVGLVAQGWSLLGTSLGPRMQHDLLSLNAPVLVWLDSDTAGTKASGKIIVELRRMGVPCNRIVTDKDPKLLPRQEIHHEIVKAYSGCR